MSDHPHYTPQDSAGQDDTERMRSDVEAAEAAYRAGTITEDHERILKWFYGPQWADHLYIKFHSA